MKRVINRQPVDTLYVLGAGASYALSYVNPRKRDYVRSITPLDNEFLKCIEKSKPSTGWKKLATEMIIHDWFDRIPATNYGLEQAVIKRINDYQFLANLHSTRTIRNITNEDYLNILSHLITAYLFKCKSNSSGETRKFVNAIFPPRVSPDNYRNRIITFNYDTLIDRPLMERGLSRRKIYFDRIVSRREDKMLRITFEKFPHPLLLKLHGSCNWRCERKYFDLMITGNIEQNNKVPIWTDDNQVPKPEDAISPLIIPPIPDKPITNTSLFNFLWTTAYEYLHEAQRIVIVGYSCPPTDTLARTMFTQFQNTKIEEIFVVDPDALALKNYRTMVDPSVASRAKWRYYASFSEYLAGELF